VWGKSLKRRPLPHAPIPLKSFAILSIGLVQNTGQAILQAALKDNPGIAEGRVALDLLAKTH